MLIFISMRLRFLILFIVGVLLTLDIRCQDTIVFQKISEPSKTILLPADYDHVYLRTNDGFKKTKVIITSLHDSIIEYRIWTYKGKEKKEARNQWIKTERDETLSLHQKDSLIKLILYSKSGTISIDKIKTVTLSNRLIPEMKKYFVILDYMWLFTALGLGSGISAKNIVFTEIFLGIAVMTLGIEYLLVRRKLRIHDKWDIILK